MSKSEIVTLQFGTYANHVGAHFWNFQDESLGLRTSSSSSSTTTNEEDDGEDGEGNRFLEKQNRFNAIDHGALYSLNETKKGDQVRTPRLVVYDVRESLGGVKQLGYLVDEEDDYFAMMTKKKKKYENVVSVSTWTGKVHVHEQPRVEKSEYLRRLEEEEEYDDDDDDKEEENVDVDDDDEERRRTTKESKRGIATTKETEETEEMINDIDRLVEAAKNLTRDATYWTDFSKALFHPRTVQVVDGIFQSSSSAKSFAGFGEGAIWACQLDRRESLREDIRKWVEECDYLRGFHVFVEDNSGFGGLCEKVLEEVRDAHGRGVTIATFCCRKPRGGETNNNNKANEGTTMNDENKSEEAAEFSEITTKRNNERRLLLNDGLSIARIAPLTDVYIPLYGSQQNSSSSSSSYQTSARIATAIDAITTPWRLKATGGFESFVGAESLATFTSRMQSQANAPFLRTSMFTRRGDFAFGDDLKFSSKMEHLFSSSALKKDSGEDLEEDLEEALAESHVIRGAKFGQSRSLCEELEKGIRAKQRVAGIPIGRCVAGASLPIPMTYPVMDNTENNNSPLLSVHAMTRQTRTQEKALSEQATNFERASRNSSGKAMLSSWGYDFDEIKEVAEHIRTDAKRYADDDF